jgi:hypothetical protein
MLYRAVPRSAALFVELQNGAARAAAARGSRRRAAGEAIYIVFFYI